MTRSMLAALAALVLLCFATAAQAHDPFDHPEMSPEWQQWFRSLTNQRNVQCCNGLDSIEPEDWRLGESGYQVLLLGKWMDVPDWAMVRQRNLLNRAQVWPYPDSDGGAVQKKVTGADFKGNSGYKPVIYALRGRADRRSRQKKLPTIK